MSLNKAVQFLAFPALVCASLSLEPATQVTSRVLPPSNTGAVQLEQSNLVQSIVDPIRTMKSNTKTHPTQDEEPPMKTKTIYLIRHAESLENVAYKGARRVQASYAERQLPALRDVADAFLLMFKMFRPSVMNAALSDVGENQVTQLHANLEKDQFWQKLPKQTETQTPASSLLVAHSPLVRAKQTAYGALLGPSCLALDAIAPEDIKDKIDLEELPSLREVNPGEIVADSLSPWRKKKAVDYRIDEFENWLQTRPEQTIVVVGHSVYFKRMLNLPETFDNCDVWEAKYDPSLQTESATQTIPSTSESSSKKKKQAEAKALSGGTTHDLPRSWTSLRRLYGYTPEPIPEVDEEKGNAKES